MTSVVKILAQMRRGSRNLRFHDLFKVCVEYFGTPRFKGSHVSFDTPWKGKPNVRIQSNKGKAKPYQVTQVLEAIDELEGMKREKEEHSSNR